jgi:hypothetical protein
MLDRHPFLPIIVGTSFEPADAHLLTNGQT